MTSQSAVFFLVCLAVVPSCQGQGQGQGFLSQKPDSISGSIRAEVKGVLGEVLGQGHGIAGLRLAMIRAKLLPLFQSLPKNNQGHLSGPVMRYAVRRYFSQEHAWILKGFEPHAEHVNTSESSEDIIQGKVPAYIRSVLEKKFAHDGFALDDLAAMVAAIERLTSDEVVRVVETSFWLNDKSVLDALNHTEMMEILSSYLITSMFGGSTDKPQHLFDKKYINLRYPHWDSTILFLIDIAGSDIYRRSSSANPFLEKRFFFSDLIRMAESVSEEFGPWSNHECHDMKDLLERRDVRGSGRVRLADFYRKSQDGAWQFTEQSEYLRQLGALDESSPSLGPQVLIPNYITGLSNCITSTPYYTICCLNECDRIYQSLEASIPASTASPNEIIKVVESMPESPNISTPLRAKLAEVAQTHNGNVPLHGRLVAQWLHFVFPHECPYPHESGTISPKTPDEWRAERGDEADSVSKDEIQQIFEIDAGLPRGAVSTESDDLLVSWTETESLLISSTASDESVNAWPNRLRAFAQVCMVISCVAIVLGKLGQVVQPDKKKVEYNV